jgi:hypothetical protein
MDQAAHDDENTRLDMDISKHPVSEACHWKGEVYNVAVICLNDKYEYGVGQIMIKRVSPLETTLSAGPSRGGVCHLCWSMILYSP